MSREQFGYPPNIGFKTVVNTEPVRSIQPARSASLMGQPATDGILPSQAPNGMRAARPLPQAAPAGY